MNTLATVATAPHTWDQGRAVATMSMAGHSLGGRLDLGVGLFSGHVGLTGNGLADGSGALGTRLLRHTHALGVIRARLDANVGDRLQGVSLYSEVSYSVLGGGNVGPNLLNGNGQIGRQASLIVASGNVGDGVSHASELGPVHVYACDLRLAFQGVRHLNAHEVSVGPGVGDVDTVLGYHRDHVGKSYQDGGLGSIRSALQVGLEGTLVVQVVHSYIYWVGFVRNRLSSYVLCGRLVPGPWTTLTARTLLLTRTYDYIRTYDLRSHSVPLFQRKKGNTYSRCQLET